MKLAVIGHGRSGKDSACTWLGSNTTLRYHESTSEAAAQICFEQLRQKYGYTTVEQAFLNRHKHRREWAEIIWRYNEPDGLRLYREMLKTNDILNGIRRAGELQALKESQMLDATIWLDRDVPEDPSNETRPADADLIISNRGTLEELYAKLTTLAKITNVLE